MSVQSLETRPPLQPDVPRKRRFATSRAVTALVLREISSSYGASPGGYLWAVIEPIGSIALLTVVFSLAFRSPPIGVNFPIYYATGMLPFLMFATVSNRVAAALRFSRSLLAYPSVTFVDAIVARFLVCFLTNLFVFGLILVGICSYFDTRTMANLPGIALSFGLAAFFGLGVGVLNCFLFSMFESWANIWSILTRPLVIVSCVLFPYDSVPAFAKIYFWFNPLVHVIGIMRHSFYVSYSASYVSITFVFGTSLVLLLFGLILLSRFYRLIVNE